MEFDQVGSYVGKELPLFKEARNWKHYVSSLIYPLTVGRDVLEVGSGIGAFTEALLDGNQRSWTCLEPDITLIAEHQANIRSQKNVDINFKIGNIEVFRNSEKFDTILYIDVLEHIKDDLEELEKASKLLHPGGRIVVLSPAHSFLYSNFDKSIGHFRRYTKGSLLAITPKELKIQRILYLDMFGMLASLGNAILLRQSSPNYYQIKFWDRVLVRLSKIFDPILNYKIGKSIYCVWSK